MDKKIRNIYKDILLYNARIQRDGDYLVFQYQNSEPYCFIPTLDIFKFYHQYVPQKEIDV